MSFRLKQIGLALCLVASLLVGSGSACTCSSHQETADASSDSCGNLHEKSHEKTVGDEHHSIESSSMDVDCVCVDNVPSPSFIGKRSTNELKVIESIANPDQLMRAPAFHVISVRQAPKPEYARNFSYSTDYKAFRPSRAPPRL